MPKRKPAGNCEIRPWLSAKSNCKEGRFIQIGNSLLLSKTFQKLSPGAQMMFLCMAMESGGRRDFKFPHSSILKYGFNKNYGAKYINELIENGFIELVSSGWTVRQANEYRFAFEWKSINH